MADGTVKQGIGQCRRNRRNQRCPFLLEQPNDLIIRLRSMFNRIYAVFQSNPDSLRAFHMRRYLQPTLMRFVTCCLYIFRRHLKDTGFASLRGIQHTARNHQLNEIRLCLCDLSHIRRRFLCAVRLVGKGTRHMSTRHGNCHIRSEYARAGLLSGINLVPESGIIIKDAANGSDCCHTAVHLRSDKGCA